MTTADAFDVSAPRYDLMTALNPGYHATQRVTSRALVARLATGAPRLADLACGTGLSTRALIRAAGSAAEVVGVDASPGMLARARAKSWPSGVTFRPGVVGRLDLGTLGRFDGVQASYLFRNVPEHDRDAAVEQVFSLLRPGGWLAVQEYAVAGDADATRRWRLVCRTIIRPLGRVVDHNPELYRYLQESVEAFDSVPAFCDRLAAAGFDEIAHRSAVGWQRGITHTIVARRPETDR